MRVFAFLAGLLIIGCSGSTSGNESGSPNGNGQDGGTGDLGRDGSSTSTALGYKSYVVIGDSISDRGGEGPFFYDLLLENDDAKYPDQKGKDLKSRFPDIKMVHVAKSGATSTGLKTQVAGIPENIPGPVLVTVTIGGNDMQGLILEILGGRDEPAREKFRSNLDGMYSELTKSGKFGADVAIRIFEANIYDPSDGKGDFGPAGCGGLIGALPTQSTSGFFTNWNAVVTDEAAKYPQSSIQDMHTLFDGHGVDHLKDKTSWYDTDCIHPNAMGHDQIRRMFYSAITGEK